MSYKATNKNIAAALAALGHEARLSVYRLLVKSGDSALKVGEISAQLDIPASTLTHHLNILVQAGLVIQEKQGREIFNRPDFSVMTQMLSFLTDECCTGVGLKINAA